MKINKNSWHFKLFEFAMKYEKSNETVCSYLRGVTFGILKVLLIALGISIIIFGMINWVVLIFTGIIIALALMHEMFAAIILFVGVLGWVSVLAASIVFSFKYLQSKETVVSAFGSTTHSIASGISNTYKKIPKIKEGSFLDILWVRIKNQHDKICTLVEFTKD